MHGWRKRNLHRNTSSQSRLVGSFFRISGHDRCFNDEANPASCDTEEHERLSAYAVHEDGTNGIEDDADRDPATLKLELLFAGDMSTQLFEQAREVTYVSKPSVA